MCVCVCVCVHVCMCAVCACKLALCVLVHQIILRGEAAAFLLLLNKGIIKKYLFHVYAMENIHLLF